jgi:hypothetical protein
MKKLVALATLALAAVLSAVTLRPAPAQAFSPPDVVAKAALAYSPPEFLVLTTPTLVPRTVASTGTELQNLGPNPIYCARKSADAIVGKAHKVSTGESWWAGVLWTEPLYCVTTVNQVTGGGTIDTEAF